MKNELINIISDLIESKREGQYWDFKGEHHNNNANLLHDILCLANALHKGNKYLIFGVSDPTKGCEIIGVNNDTNRKNQANLIDFLRCKHFAGDIRPEIELRTIAINNVVIDVLVIFDRPQKLYYLRDDYRDNGKTVRASNVYTRVLDTNTPIDKSADIRIIENMWRERFGLDVSPLEKLKLYLLEHESWQWNGVDSAYYKYFPEFTIKIENTSERKNKNVWWDGWPVNEPLSNSIYKFNYHATAIDQLNVIHCMREDFSFPYPDVDYIQVDDSKYGEAENTYSLFYYVKDSLKYSLLHHLLRGSSNCIQSLTKPPIKKLPFIQFENEDEKERFKIILKEQNNEFFTDNPGFPRKKLGDEMLEEEKKFAYWSYRFYGG